MKNALTSLWMMLAFIGYSASMHAQDEPFLGTWDLDIAASNFGGTTPPAAMSRSYGDLGNGSYMYLVVSNNEDGSLGGSSATYKFDGKLYPIATLNQTAQASISYRMSNERNVEYTVTVDGQVTQIGAKTISSNGTVLTIAIQFPNSNQANQILRFNRRR